MQPTIAFTTANLVARYSGYRFTLNEWGVQEKLTREKTDEQEFAAICREIAAAGFRAVEVWVAHVDPPRMTDERAAACRAAMQECGLTPIALAGALTDASAKVCRALGIPAACGGYWGSDKATSIRVMRETGVLYNYENHPEKSVEEIRAQVDHGENGLAVALDTGWLGTQGVDAPEAVRRLGRLIRHVHLKDVAKPGGHHTVRLGAGCVDIPGVVRELKAIGYSGAVSWEDEPEDRNPLDVAVEMRLYIQRLWSRA